MTGPPARLPEPPKVELERMRETRLGEGGFLVLRRMELCVIRDGERSPSFSYDIVDRRALDAAVMIAHHREAGQTFVWLRSSLRPPVGLRTDGVRMSAVLWELPAGLIEPGESPRAAAKRELAEELGFDVAEGALEDLGPPSLPAPGFIGEQHHFFHVEVDPATRTEPDGDGSAIEAGARVIAVALADALAACARGELHDEKTELALRRLSDVVEGSHGSQGSRR